MSDTADLTPELGLPLPHPGNALAADVVRLRAALMLIDEALEVLASGSAAKVHGHTIDAIDGLAVALAAKAASADAVPARASGNQGRVLASDGADAAWVSPVFPTAGPGDTTFTRTGDNITSITSTANGKSVSVGLARSGGQLASVTTTHDGATRTVTLTRDGSGRVSGFTVA